MADLHPMIFPPVLLDADSRPVWSVQVELPPEIDQEIRRYVAEDELTSWTLTIHGALYLYRTLFWTRERLNAELEGMIEEGYRSAEKGGGREASPAFWAEFRQRTARNAERLSQLRAEGKVGNLLLPQELYAFILERIESGQCRTPTDVVCAATPYLRREREERKKPPEDVDDVYGAAVFEFTPAQKNLLEALSHETGRSIPSLITQALNLLCKKYGKPPLPDRR